MIANDDARPATGALGRARRSTRVRRRERPGATGWDCLRTLVGPFLVIAVAGCSPGDPASQDSTATTAARTAGSSTTTAADPHLADDEVWVLGDPSLTFVRIEPDKAVPLGAGSDDVAPLTPGTRLLLRYTTPSGGAVYLEQGALVDPDVSIQEAAPFGSTTSSDGERPYAIGVRGPGEAPILTTVAGGRRVVISGAEDQLRPLASTLRPIGRRALDEMVEEVSITSIREGDAESLAEGITLYSPTSGELLACIDGREPEGCASADHYGPMVMAPIPEGSTYVIAGCIFSQPVPVTEVVVNGREARLQTSPCGVAFTATDVAPGGLTIAFDDGPGGVGTYALDLP